jgi:hypothetical protein
VALSPILNYSSYSAIASSWFTTQALNHTGFLSVHQSSDTGFHRRTFPFLGTSADGSRYQRTFPSSLSWVSDLSPRHSHSDTPLSIFWNCLLLSRSVVSGSQRMTRRSKSKLLYDWWLVSQTVSMSWYRAPLWDLRPDVTFYRNVVVWNLWSCFCEEPSLTRGRVCNLQYNPSIVRVALNP